ncbi:MAG TPA: 5'-3' exonuclease H3TH domain-containing protein [Candidatus Peribacterales bacterium]|nr:5'-3' exonuclease H3TH domain-containing protein [Candidatus Peribacterales bacterium]
MSKKLLLLDGNHLMHRAFWAIQRSLSTSKGEQTNTVFGVASMLLTMLQREKPDAIVACFDEGKETHRHKLHDAYKAGRQETPDDFYTQIPRVHQCFAAFSIPTVSNPEYEADDLIGTLALRGAKEGWEVIIVTGDRDLFQMANHAIRIAIPHKGYAEPEYLDANGVEGKLGVRPDQVPDYKGLVGDASDNLKGVKGIGPKSGEALLKKYGTLESVYEHLEDIQGTSRSKLESDRESAFFCRDMARLVTDAPIDLDLEPLAGKGTDLSSVERFFMEMEFYTLRSRLKKLVQSNEFMRTYLSGESILPSADDEQGVGDKMTVEQLPLLD